ncbi:Alpha-1,3-mannosyltransferase CMT1 [Coccomyxa sp. Obi]|nr:Alpha-1,3-mannosyltransferase CMT1 [Coccomyxa sp. Obi]
MAAAMWQNCSRKCKGLRKGRLALLNGAGAWPQCVSQSPKLAALWVLLVIWLLYMLCFTGSGKPRSHRLTAQPTRAQTMAFSLAGKVAELNLGQYSPELLKLAVRQAVNPAEAASHLREIQAEDSTTEFGSLMGKMQGIVWDLSHAKSTVDCVWDPTLHLGALGKGENGGTERYLIAANMHNNEEVLPHFIIQLVHLFAVLPPETAFLSIYESGSTDSTGAWLEVLRNLLAAMQIPHRIVIGGSLTRAKDQDRIEFLAQARNRALEPLWLNGSLPTSTSLLLPHDPEVTDRKLSAWGLPSGKARAKPMWPAERVVFLNDVFFCARDVVRLLQHRADMVCGMDFDRPKLEEMPWEFQRRRFAEYWRRKWVPQWLGLQLGRIGPIMFQWRDRPTIKEAFKAESPMEFYDIWVARDSDGNLFLKQTPYVTDPYSLDRIARGLPFPVKCCWNGLVILNSAPFLRHNVRVRGHKKGECAASECTLLCNDYLRLGYSKFIVDPSVRLAYTHRDANDVHKKEFVQGIRSTDWADVQSSAPIDWSLTPHRPYYKCCGLPPGHDMIEFDKDCKWDNFMSPNFTSARPYARLPQQKNWSSADAGRAQQKEWPVAFRGERL